MLLKQSLPRTLSKQLFATRFLIHFLPHICLNTTVEEKLHTGCGAANGCHSIESRTKEVTELEDKARGLGNLIVRGCVSCPHGPRHASVFNPHNSEAMELIKCRAQVELPRFNDDAMNQQARELWPDTPHRNLDT
jgi:hypothetical protein